MPARPGLACSLMNASAVGRQAPSPRPARKRNVVNWPTLWASPVAMVSTENAATLVIRVLRRPNRSVSGPIVTAPMPMPTSPSVEAVVTVDSVKPRAPVPSRVGMTTPEDDEVEAVEGDRDPAEQDRPEVGWSAGREWCRPPGPTTGGAWTSCAPCRESCEARRLTVAAHARGHLHPVASAERKSGGRPPDPPPTVVLVTDILEDAPTAAGSSDAAASTQAEVSAEIAGIAREYAESPAAAGDGETQPRLDYPPYRSSVLRHPTKDLAPRRPRGRSSCGRRCSAIATSTRSRPT